MNTKLLIGDELCNSFEQLQDFIRVIPNVSEVYSDILECGRSGDLSKWLREHDKEALAKEMDAIDINISDREFINKVSLIILNKTPKLRKTDFRACFYSKVELCRTKENELMILFLITPTKDVNEDFEIKAVCGLETKLLIFNPSKYDIGNETKKYIVFENYTVNHLDSVVVYVNGEQIFEDSLKNYYLHSQYESLNKRFYIGSLSGNLLYELISRFSKINPVYNTTQITENNFAVNDILRTIYDITGFDFSASTIKGRSIEDATDYMSKVIIIREKENWNTLKKTIGINDNTNIVSFEINDLFNTFFSCSQSKNIKPWDTIDSTDIDIKNLISIFSTKFGMSFSELEIKKQNKIDNLLLYIINKYQSKLRKSFTMEEVIKAFDDYARSISNSNRIPFKSFSSKSEVFDYIKENSKFPKFLNNKDIISETIDWNDLYAKLLIVYGIELETMGGTIKDLVNSIWNASPKNASPKVAIQIIRRI